MSVKKQFLKSGNICKITFRLSKEDAQNADSMFLCGTFSDWETDGVPMNKLKTGDFTTVVSLPANERFEYRFLKNESEWVNDSEAESFCDNGMGEHNCVINTTPE